ncbi:MAG TPA: hypothetical protein VMA96_11915 [Solirubrobacteraceae bacterium]|nr:hypothetical protein [Solirubrobacteraceae bacterium]
MNRQFGSIKPHFNEGRRLDANAQDRTALPLDPEHMTRDPLHRDKS